MTAPAPAPEDASPAELASAEAPTLVRRRAGRTLALWALFIVGLLSFEASPAHGLVLCPFRFITGLSCPGCGMTRACMAAVRGHWVESLSYHPLGVAFVLAFTLTASLRAVELWRGQRVALASPWARLLRLGSIAVLIFVMAFGALRLGLELAGILTPV